VRKPAVPGMENHHALDKRCDSVCFMAFKSILRFGWVDTNTTAAGTGRGFHQNNSGQKTGRLIPGETSLILADQCVLIGSWLPLSKRFVSQIFP
jgi:hypothetical protein